MSEHLMLIGACGWRHPVWTDEYYPEGLPDDWQLGFYGNEYRVVLVPAAYWQDANIDVRQWLDDTDDSLLFLCEWPQAAAAQQRALAAMRILGPRVPGVVITLAAMPAERDLSIYKELQARYQLSVDLGQLPADQVEAVLAQLQQSLGKDSFGLVWHGQRDQVANLQCGPMAVTRISQVRDARDLRRIIEAALAVGRQDRIVALIIDGEPPDIQLMQNAGIILDLL